MNAALIPTVIVDDDLSSINILLDHISEIPILRLPKIFTEPIEALTSLAHEKEGHLIFLDINMPGVSGITLAENLKYTSHKIIFTTCFPEYALQAIKVRAKEYLLKPFDLQELVTAVIIVINESYNKTQNHPLSNLLIFRTEKEPGKLIAIPKDDIVYVQGSNNHVHIYTNDDDYSVYLTLKELKDRLKNDSQFYRVHKSFMLNSNYLKNINGNKINLGKYDVLMSEQYKADFITDVKRILITSSRPRSSHTF